MRDCFGKGIKSNQDSGFGIRDSGSRHGKEFLVKSERACEHLDWRVEIEPKVNRLGPAQWQMAVCSQPVPSHEQTAKAQAFRSFKGSQAASSIASGPAASFADPRKPQTEATQT